MIRDRDDRAEEAEEAKKRRDRGESSAPKEAEPNDEPDQASSLELGGDLRPMRASIDEEGDRDWFGLTSRDGESWRIELLVEPEGDDLDPVVHLDIGDGELTEYDIAGAGEAETVPVLGVSSKAQRVRVSGKDGSTGDYELSFKKRLSGGEIEAEPNDAVDVATRFEAPGEIQGFYDRPGDRDIYYVPGEDLDEEVFNVEVSAANDFEQTVRLYTEEELDSAHLTLRVPPDRAAGLPNLALGDAIAGVWLVLEADDVYDREHSYRLKLLPHQSVEHALEAEPNDSFEQAQEFELGEELAGYFHSDDDVDRFRLSLEDPSDEKDADGEDADGEDEADDEAGDEDADDLRRDDREEGDEGADRRPDPLEEVEDKEPVDDLVRVDLVPESEDDLLALAHSEHADGEGLSVIEPVEAGEPATLCNEPVEEDSLQLEVRQIQTDREGLGSTFDYRLLTEDVGDVSGLEIEPNDAREEADKLTDDQGRVGFIAEAGDVDVYAFSVPFAQSAEDDGTDASDEGALPGGDRFGERRPQPESDEPRGVELELSANPLDLGFEVLDDEGGLIAEVDRAGAGAPEKLSLDLPPGLYYVHVSADGASSCEPYELDVAVESE